MDKNYWEERYLNKETGWDVGYVTTPLKYYIDQIKNKELKILIPGAGNGYEAEYLFNNGFKNIYVVDIAQQPLQNIAKRIPELKNNLLYQDFFSLNDTYDLIIEQTFFCALLPELRKKYVEKMYSLLSANGKLVGLLFCFPLTESGPPFGGSKEEYIDLFKQKFELKTLEKSYNSITPRANNELFFIFNKIEE